MKNATTIRVFVSGYSFQSVGPFNLSLECVPIVDVVNDGKKIKKLFIILIIIIIIIIITII